MGAKIGSIVCPDCMDTQDNYHKEKRPTEKMSEAEIIEDIEILSSQDLGELLFNSRMRTYQGRRSLNLKQRTERIVRFSSLQIRKRTHQEMCEHSDSTLNTADYHKAKRHENSTNPLTMETGEGTPSRDNQSDHASIRGSSPSHKGSASVQGDGNKRSDIHPSVKHVSRSREGPSVQGRQAPDQKSMKDSEAMALSGILDEELPCLALELQDKVTPLPKDKPVSELGSRSRRSGPKQVGFTTGFTAPPVKPTQSVKHAKSLKSQLSMNPSAYSFKSCLEFDNLTFNSMLSGGFKSVTSRAGPVKSPGRTSKQDGKWSSSTFRQAESKMDLFHELMFELESLSECFNLLKPLPMEEPLITERSAQSQSTPEQKLVLFAPKILELECDGGNRAYKKRVLVSRGTSVVRSSLRELGIQANKQVADEACSRVIKRSLASYLDFDSDWDTRIQYNLKGEGGVEGSTTTIRIGTGKKFPNGKTFHYVFERSIDVEEFYSCKEDMPIEALTPGSAGRIPAQWFLLKHISKVEVLNPEFLKIDTYVEFVVPQDVRLAVARKLVRAWWLLGGNKRRDP